MKAARLVIALALTLCFIPLAGHAATADEAVVTSATLPMHAETRSSSAVVRTLRGGDTVTIEHEGLGGGGRWCFVREAKSSVMGYVPCANIQRKAEGDWWNSLLNDAGKESAEENIGQYSNVRVVMYMTDW
jgi:hypothetical protein